MQPHVPEVQHIRHAAEHRHRDGEPPVHEQAHTRVAYRQNIEEQRVHEQPGSANQQEHPVPFLNPFGSRVQHPPNRPTRTPGTEQAATKQGGWPAGRGAVVASSTVL